jgi:hypothetical protein
MLKSGYWVPPQTPKWPALWASPSTRFRRSVRFSEFRPASPAGPRPRSHCWGPAPTAGSRMPWAGPSRRLSINALFSAFLPIVRFEDCVGSGQEGEARQDSLPLRTSASRVPARHSPRSASRTGIRSMPTSASSAMIPTIPTTCPSGFRRPLSPKATPMHPQRQREIRGSIDAPILVALAFIVG